MPRTADEKAYRVRLEGRAELLEATRLRYRALVPMLQAFRWRRRLLRDARLLREVARVQDEVDEALSAVERRVRLDGWSPDAEVVRCAREVSALRAELEAAVSRRLEVSSGELGLKGRLERLEVRLLTEPRLVLPGQRMSTAVAVLPESLPELRRAHAWSGTLEHLFNRPLTAGARLPFTLEELDALASGWAAGDAAVEAVWQRLASLDAAGTLVRYLRRRARRTPLKPPANGAQQLLHAEFWRSMAAFRLTEAIDARVGPLACRDGERFHVLRWLWQRERDEEARLEAREGLDEGRAGCFELAYEVASAPVRRGAAQWERLSSRARRADAAQGTADWEALSDQLRLLVRVLDSPTAGAPRALAPVYRAEGRRPELPTPPSGEAATLEGLVSQLRDRRAPR